jgi:hypothetical protein
MENHGCIQVARNATYAQTHGDDGQMGGQLPWTLPADFILFDQAEHDFWLEQHRHVS